MKPIAAEWVARAEEDYVTARHLHRQRRFAVLSIVCFHCQHCAEKYLKALLAEIDIGYPKTHDLLALPALAAPKAEFPRRFCDHLEVLNDYAVEFRYPDGSATVPEARTALLHCRTARSVMRKARGLDEPPSAQMKLLMKERAGRYRVQGKG
jgi:HEPN domain-containing protein